MIRWVFVLKYPPGVSLEEGERWYLSVHTQEAKQMAEHGLISYKTWKAIPPPDDLPERTRERASEYARLTELVFRDWDAYREATERSGVTYSPAPYGEKGFLYYTLFLSEEPEYDLLSEVPSVA